MVGDTGLPLWRFTIYYTVLFCTFFGRAKTKNKIEEERKKTYKKYVRWNLMPLLLHALQQYVYSTIKVEAISFDEMKWERRGKKHHIWRNRFLLIYIFNTIYVSRYALALHGEFLLLSTPQTTAMQYLLWLLFFIFIRWDVCIPRDSGFMWMWIVMILFYCSIRRRRRYHR